MIYEYSFNIEFLKQINLKVLFTAVIYCVVPSFLGPNHLSYLELKGSIELSCLVIETTRTGTEATVKWILVGVDSFTIITDKYNKSMF